MKKFRSLWRRLIGFQLREKFGSLDFFQRAKVGLFEFLGVQVLVFERMRGKLMSLRQSI